MRVAVSATALRGGGLVDLVVTDSSVQDYDPASSETPPITIVLNVGTKTKHKWLLLADLRKTSNSGAALKPYARLRPTPTWLMPPTLALDQSGNHGFRQQAQLQPRTSLTNHHRWWTARARTRRVRPPLPEESR